MSKQLSCKHILWKQKHKMKTPVKWHYYQKKKKKKRMKEKERKTEEKETIGMVRNLKSNCPTKRLYSTGYFLSMQQN